MRKAHVNYSHFQCVFFYKAFTNFISVQSKRKKRQNGNALREFLNFLFSHSVLYSVSFLTPLLFFFFDYFSVFDVHESVHREYISIYVQQDATLPTLFIYGNCSTCFGCYFHPTSGAHTTVSTASGICPTFTATCCYRVGIGT